MGLSVWIRPENQYGVLRLQDARPGARRRALVEGIKRQLFDIPGGPDFATVLRAFGDAAAEIEFPQAETVSLWEELTANGDERRAADSRPGGDTATMGEGARTFDHVFSIALHGLCQALATEYLQAESEDPSDEAGDTNVPADEGVSLPRVYADRESGLWAREALARGIVAALLVQSLPYARRNTDEPQLARDARLIAAALLDRLVVVLGAWFERWQDRPGQPHWIHVRTPELSRRVAGLLAELPYFHTPQPLVEPVAYRLGDPGPADTDECDYHRVDLIGYRRTNVFLRRLHDRAAARDWVAPGFQRYVDAVNVQQAVAWRLNLPLLDQAMRLAEFAKDPAKREQEARRVGLDDAATEALLAWITRAFYEPVDTRARRRYLRPGEILDHPLMSSSRAALAGVGRDGAPARFFLPWKADYRGRLYAETPWLTPQGGDLQRALLEFADGRPLDAGGVTALRRHGANLVKRGRISSDLEIGGRQVVTLAERERWIETHQRDILASAAAPIAEPFWREVADKPMQFLAFCLAYRQWTLDPTLPVHLPVQIDGTCNGLQHIAALTGDANLAQAVNVLPRDDGLPGDIYSEVAVAARETLGHIAALLSAETAHREGLEIVDAWLAETPETWLDRTTAKRVIMTVPYGAREGSQAEYVADAIAGRVEALLGNGLDFPQIDALCEWVAADAARGKSLYRLTKGQFKALRKLVFDSAAVAKKTEQTLRHGEAKDHIAAVRVADLQIKQEWHRLEAEKAAQRLRRLEIVTAYAARVIVKHLRHALAETFPSIDRFSAWLRQKASACAGLPLVWPTPLGFPVCQDKFALEGGSASARLSGGKSIRIDLQRLSDRVEPNGQRDALLPNLIHSFDATHLAKTLLELKARGIVEIGSIHDCLLCQPNDAEAVADAVRRTFARLYERGLDGTPVVLTDWSDWMDGIAHLMPLDNPETVLGALDHPGGVGAKLLAAQALTPGEAGAAAKQALELIAALRRLPPARQWLMRSLLELMSRESAETRAARQDVARRIGQVAGPDMATGIPFGGGSSMSEYFFS